MATVIEKHLHPFDAAKAAGRLPYKVKDLALADFGRKEMRREVFLLHDDGCAAAGIRKRIFCLIVRDVNRDRDENRGNSPARDLKYGAAAGARDNDGGNSGRHPESDGVEKAKRAIALLVGRIFQHDARDTRHIFEICRAGLINDIVAFKK